MTKSELKTGYIVTLRNGEEYMVVLDVVSQLRQGNLIVPESKYGWNNLSNYNEDLTNTEFEDFDIIKVELPFTIQNISADKGERKLLWEKKEMSSKIDKEIMQNAVNTYGVENQMIKTIEELAELSQNLSKALILLNSKSDKTLSADLKSVDNIFKEMADVEIMLEQCKMMFKCEEEVQNWKEKKIARLAEHFKSE